MNYRRITQIVLPAFGVLMIVFGAYRGEAAVVLAKAIRLWMEYVRIGLETKFHRTTNSTLSWLGSGSSHITYKYTSAEFL